MTLQLRPYQSAALAALDTYWDRAKGNPLLVMPTGSGKSCVIAEFVRRTLTAWPDTTILMLTHVRELVQQNADELRRLWPEIGSRLGIYSAGLGLRQVRAVTFAGIQSVYDQGDRFGHVDLVLVDEAHLVPSKGDGMYRRLLGDLQKQNPKVKVIGLTATAFRTDSGMLTDQGGIFTDIAYDVDLLSLMRDGYLTKLLSKPINPAAEIDASGVPVRAGEFGARELELVATDDAVVHAALRELVRSGKNRKAWLLFCCGVDHGHAVAETLKNEFAIPCEMIDGQTPLAERDAIIGAFRSGKLRALSNANVLTTGFNVPHIDLIGVLRPTKSPGLWCQMVGRGLRPAEGKTDCLVLDFGENVARHGPINAIRPRRRQADGSMSAPEAHAGRVCFDCGTLEVVRADVCLGCGVPWPKPPATHRPSASTAAVVSEPEILQVVEIAYGPHRKAGKPPSMVVSYLTERNEWIDEWVCLEHAGYARQRAVSWWLKRADAPAPDSVEEALARTSELRPVSAIKVGMEGGFWRVLGYWFAEPGANAPTVAQPGSSRDDLDDIPF